MAKSNLLVIDDDADICTLLTRFLTKQGFGVDSAQRGSTAKDLLKQKHYDLVLCDHRLPDTDSVEMLQHIKGISRDTAVIIITGYSDVRIAVDPMRIGAFDYVGKPLYPDEILMRIKDPLAEGAGEKPDAPKAKPQGTGAKSQDDVHGSGRHTAHLPSSLAT